MFLDDDVVVQQDLSLVWDIDMKGKVNGAVETCRGNDTRVMSKKFKNYLNFSNPSIVNKFDPEKCAWAYGMNIFDLEAWRKSNITQVYHYWVKKVNTLLLNFFFLSYLLICVERTLFCILWNTEMVSVSRSNKYNSQTSNKFVVYFCRILMQTLRCGVSVPFRHLWLRLMGMCTPLTPLCICWV